jgi:hypothetical protein
MAGPFSPDFSPDFGSEASVTVVVLTGTSGSPQTWTVPGDCPVGTSVLAEAWGAGSGGSGTGATNGGGGGGGAYASSNYIVTPNDVASGISYILQAGGAGNTGVGSVGPDTSWSTNNINTIQDSTNIGAVVGTIGGAGSLPTLGSALNSQWNLFSAAGATVSVVGFGTSPEGFPYVDISVTGTCTSGIIQIAHGWGTATASASWTYSTYLQLMSGNFTNVTGFNLGFDSNSGTLAAPSYISTPLFSGIANPTGTLTRFSGAATTAAGTTNIVAYTYITTSTTLPLNFTLRIAGVQQEQAASATFFKSTPGYTLADGGAAPITTGGGAGGSSANSIGSIATFVGGSGRAYNAAGSPGGGAAGPLGTGGTPSTTTSGTGNNGGVAGVAVASTSPGNAGVSNVEAGSGGGALISVLGTGGAGGAPGGGGGGSDFTSGTRTGGAGGRGQIRLTYTAVSSGSIGTITAVANVAGVGRALAIGQGTVTAVANVAGVGAVNPAAPKGTITAVTNVAGVGRSTARAVGTITAAAVVQGVSGSLSIVGDITLNPIGNQPPEFPFDVSGTYDLLPSLQFADDAGSVFTDLGLGNITPVGTVTFDFTHPGMPAGSHIIQVSDLATGTSAAEGYFVDPTAVPGRGALLADSPTSIQFIIPAYLYEQYRDDQDCQAFIDAYNAIAQNYLDWFNTINLPIYTGLSGPLLDWVAQGLYGISRPSIALSQTSGSGAFNTYKLDQITIDGSTAATTSQVFVVTDEIFKRIITWLFYKGDGRQFSVTWLKRRIMRFLNGVAGTDPGVDQAYQVSVQFTGTTVVNITISSGSAPTTYAPVLRAALLSGVIPLPFQFSYNVLLT